MTNRCLRIATASCAIVIALSTSIARADLVLSIQPTTQTIQVGEQGYFDVLFTNDGDTFELESYGVELTGGSGFVYDNVTRESPNSIDYAFPTPDSGGLLTFATSPNVRYIDNGDSGSTGAITSGGTYGMGRVYFTGTAAGVYNVTFATADTEGTFAIQSNGAEIPISLATGTQIIVQAVPEPASAILLGLSGLAGVYIQRRRKQRHTATVA